MMFPDTDSFLLNTQILSPHHHHHQKEENQKRKNILNTLGFGTREKCQKQSMWEVFDKSSHHNPEHNYDVKKKTKNNTHCWQHNKSKELVNMLSVFQSGETHSTFQPQRSSPSCLSVYKPTNKSLENCREHDEWLMLVGKKQTREKLSNLPKNEKLKCSLLVALSSVCTILVFTKVLWSFVCFNTFQGFVFFF